jgi:hypothetical protein
LDVFVPFASPLVTCASCELLVALTVVFPFEEMPATCPPTASPLLDVPLCVVREVLSPTWWFGDGLGDGVGGVWARTVAAEKRPMTSVSATRAHLTDLPNPSPPRFSPMETRSLVYQDRA